MKRAALIAGALLAVAASDRWAAIVSPPIGASGLAEAAETPIGSARAKLRELEEILRSRNDNDPRLSRDFNGLTPEAKRLFREKYRAVAPEKRNQRGTIVYLLGLNLRSREDWEFLRRVALEPPCLSLMDCSKKPAPGSDDEASGDEVTLAYPSLVALHQAQAAAEAAGDGASGREARDLFAAAKKSATPAVVRMATSLEKKLGPRKP